MKRNYLISNRRFHSSKIWDIRTRYPTPNR
jgi:hypothetical protein